MNKLLVAVALDYVGKLVASAGTVLAANDYIATKDIPDFQHAIVLLLGLAITAGTKAWASRNGPEPENVIIRERPSIRASPDK